jgi:hypothetical protein
MKSRMWRLAGLGLLCLSSSAHVLAEGSFEPGTPGAGPARPAPGQVGAGPARPMPGQAGAGPGRVDQGQAQNQNQNQNQTQGRQDGQRQQQRPQNQTEWQQRVDQFRNPTTQQRQPQGQPNPPPSQNPIQGKPDTVWQTQEPVRGHWDDRRNDGNRHWQAGDDRRPGYRPPGYDDRQPGRGNGWGAGPQYRPGQMIDRFPDRYDRVPWRGQDYYYSGGYWYRPQGQRYEVVTAPYGVRTRYLPDYAQRMWIGSSVFFLAAGTYYQYQDNTQDYVVVNPPVQQVIQAPPLSPTYSQQVPNSSYDVDFQPANGQSPEQVAQDRYDCQQWAVQQSGFDPARVSYAPAPEVVNVYRQNMANCLSSRGYRVD